MKVATPEQMNKIDTISINQFGIPGVVLMENAALGVAYEIEKTLEKVYDKNIIIFAGKGNNGGDAFVVARHLFNRGAQVKVYLFSEKQSINGDAKINLDIIDKMGIRIVELLNEEYISQILNDIRFSDMIVDGILGTGLKGEVRGIMSDVINIINASKKTVISIDIPSGVSGETGKILGTSIKADKTVTFCLPKVGVIVHPGCEVVGELIVTDISIPKTVVDGEDIKVHLIDRGFVSSLIPKRQLDSNKGDYGKVLIITGSKGMTGAGCLTAGSALRTGAGLVYLGVPAALTPIYNMSMVEAISIPLEDNGTGFIASQCMDVLRENIKKMDVVAIGPGLSTNGDVVDVVNNIIEISDIPLVIDADALNVISKDVSILSKLKSEAVITPHPGEMARLCGISIKEVQENRLEVAKSFAVKWNVITVLKGSRTVVALPDGTIFINSTGNPGMATGGSGDVLTGIIASLIGQGLRANDAAAVGVYIHGMAGDFAAEKKGESSIIASDIVKAISFAIKELKK